MLETSEPSWTLHEGLSIVSPVRIQWEGRVDCRGQNQTFLLRIKYPTVTHANDDERSGLEDVTSVMDRKRNVAPGVPLASISPLHLTSKLPLP